MRFKGFIRKEIHNGISEFHGFRAEHFRQAGLGYSPEGGMPVLEAYQLVNQFNQAQAQAHPRFVYWLE